MIKTVPWSAVIKRSFNYNERYAFEIKQYKDGIILREWEKYGCDINKAIWEGSIFLKPEMIIQIINSIRSVPEDELELGTTRNYYGEWSRSVTLPFELNNKSYTVNIEIKNIHCEGYRRLMIQTYFYDEQDEYVFITQLEKLSSIIIYHSGGYRAFCNEIEPILAELSKYIPQEKQSQILDPICKTKSKVDIEFEEYLLCFKIHEEEMINKPYAKWIKKQIDDLYYEVTLCIFYNKKVEYEKTILCSTTVMSMISTYFHHWNFFIKTLPYKIEKDLIKIEILSDSKYDGHSNIKITIKESNDFFEFPYNSEFCIGDKIYGIANKTDAAIIYTNYYNKIHGFFDDEFLILKCYTYQNTYELLYINKLHTKSFYNAIKNDLPLFIANPALYKNGKTLIYDGFTICIKFNYYENSRVSIKIKSDAGDSEDYIYIVCFLEDFVSQIHEIESVLEDLVKDEASLNFNKDLKLIKWDLNKKENRYYLVWQYENCAKHAIELSEEKIYKIQEYAFWWWRATDHSQKYGFSDDEIFYEINPSSDKKGLGLLTLKFKNHKEDSLETYFDLSDSKNLPKNFCAYLENLNSYSHSNMLRKAKIIDTEEFLDLYPDFEKSYLDRYFYISFWDSKYQNIDFDCRRVFIIDRQYFAEFKSAINELHNYLCCPQNKVSELLSNEVEDKFNSKGNFFSFYNFVKYSKQVTNIDDDVSLEIYIHPIKRTYREKYETLILPGTRQSLIKQLEILLNAIKS